MDWEPDLGFEHTRVAADLARRGTVAEPSRPGNWLVLSRALINLGDFDGATASLRDAVAAAPQSAELQCRLAEVLLAQDMWEEALPHAEAALQIAPDHPRAMLAYLDLLILLRAYDKLDMPAVAALSDKSPHAMMMHAKALGSAGMLEFCDSLLARNPRHTNARYRKAIALALLGREEEARGLVSVERLVETRELPTPAGYPDGDTFRQMLAREICANPTLSGDPRSKATRGGLQTRSLRQPHAVAVEALLGKIREAVDAYLERLAAQGDEFALSRPARARLRAWAVIYGGGGQQTPHVHPQGWITGVYYVSAPRGRGENAYRGPLVLGADIPIKGLAEPPWATREIEPVPGRLVLFPSHVPHATVPPGGEDGARICVTFDVVDAAA
jgi:uncharacterized protein (TIGR02466 family)